MEAGKGLERDLDVEAGKYKGSRCSLWITFGQLPQLRTSNGDVQQSLELDG